MNTIGPGDWIECIEADQWQEQSIVPGNIYRCVEVLTPTGATCTLHGTFCYPASGISLAGKSLPDDWCWCALSFRPIYKPKSEIIQGLLQPVLEDA